MEFLTSPYSAAFKHARVDQVGAHQGHVDAVLLRGLQLVAQRLVEPDGAELTGTVILCVCGVGGGSRLANSDYFFSCTFPPGNLRRTLANPPARKAREPPLFAVNDTTTTRRHKA